MLKGGEGAGASTGKGGSKTAAGAAAAANVQDVKAWFKCYDVNADHLYDHIIRITEDDTENWSVITGASTSTVGSQQQAAAGTSPIKVSTYIMR